ncbi:hypothetical protein K8R04_04995 [Candidatus Uhrbacteria bacterium]|nr:hypothetical protein [Candidatus Uhrbacteria bacterium]
MHRVATSPDLIPDDRNFGARLEKDVLILPELFLPLLVEYKIETSELFYALTLTESRAVARALGWELEQVVKARRGLAHLIQKSIAPPPPSPPASTYSWGPLPRYPPSSFPPKKKIG